MLRYVRFIRRDRSSMKVHCVDKQELIINLLAIRKKSRTFAAVYNKSYLTHEQSTIHDARRQCI